MLSRRTTLKFGMAVTTLQALVTVKFVQKSFANDAEDDYLGNLPNIDLRTYDPRADVTKGTAPAQIEEEETAKRIFGDASKYKSHMDLAEFFAEITEENKNHERYNAGWRERWNPVIRQFFVATATKPSGDITPWCAAFLNWCLLQEGAKRTKNASAVSFRTLGSPTNSPQKGDIVVFEDKLSPGHGHVGFYLEQDANRGLLVLGGNQTSKRNHHVVSAQWLPRESNRLSLHSIRDQQSFAAA